MDKVYKSISTDYFNGLSSEQFLIKSLVLGSGQFPENFDSPSVFKDSVELEVSLDCSQDPAS
jgi:hypothetical protein